MDNVSSFQDKSGQTVSSITNRGYIAGTGTGDQMINSTEQAINELLILVTTAFLIQIQLGFAMIENGLVRSKNSKNILIKNLFDASIGGIAFWISGFGLAFGVSPGGFIGINGAMFASADFSGYEKNLYLQWILQFSFAATCATIVSGSLAERTQLPSYLAFSALMTGFIYPVVVGWTWGGGWLSSKGFHDFSGSGLIHVVGGTAGFIGATILGPRHGKEKNAATRKNVLDDPDTIKWINDQNCPAEVKWWVNELQKDD